MSLSFQLAPTSTLAVSLALKHLSHSLKVDAVFWGVIRGTENDHIIAVERVSKFGEVKKTFFVLKYDLN